MSEPAVVRLATFDAAELRRAGEGVHWLPCTIEHTGPAPVSKYFYPAATELLTDGVPVLEATFRGRLLRGNTHVLPEGNTGVVLAKEPRGNAWRVTSGFDRMTAWNHDTAPGSADPAPRLMQWLRLASILGAAVTAEEVTARVAQDKIAKADPSSFKHP